jgi:hypothetical protein
MIAVAIIGVWQARAGRSLAEVREQVARRAYFGCHAVYVVYVVLDAGVRGRSMRALLPRPSRLLLPRPSHKLRHQPRLDTTGQGTLL